MAATLSRSNSVIFGFLLYFVMLFVLKSGLSAKKENRKGQFSTFKSDRSSYDGDALQTQQQRQSLIHNHTNNPLTIANRQSSSALLASKPYNYTNGNASDDFTNNNKSINKSNNKTTNKPPPPPPLPPSNTSTLKSVKSHQNTLTRNHIITNLNNNNDIASNQSTLKRTSNNNNSRADQDSQQQVDNMQEELKQVLTLFREKRRNLDITKTPDIFITQSSSADEVQEWLKAKQFSDVVCKRLNKLNGNELFALNKNTLEEYCGVDEGRRLASQITLQQNVSGYKTARSSELLAILARARLKTEPAAGEKDNQ